MLEETGEFIKPNFFKMCIQIASLLSLFSTLYPSHFLLGGRNTEERETSEGNSDRKNQGEKQPSSNRSKEWGIGMSK